MKGDTNAKSGKRQKRLFPHSCVLSRLVLLAINGELASRLAQSYLEYYSAHQNNFPCYKLLALLQVNGGL